ncbi:MAG: UPF0262 family protein [Phycisphaerales bacterium]|nr:UPF0262 family protein [Phycisphaerales bacterium]
MLQRRPPCASIMFEVRLHGALWKSTTPARADEWRRALEEINASNSIEASGFEVGDEPAIEVVRPPTGEYLLRLYRDGFDQAAQIQLEPERMTYLFDEYGATIRQMVHVDREAPIRGFEALDYAKRVVHDEAGEYLMDVLADHVLLDLVDARRLFTLIFLVGTDIPEELVKYHRIH